MINNLSHCRVCVFWLFCSSSCYSSSPSTMTILYLTNLLSSSLISIWQPSSSQGLEFCDPPPFPSSRYVRQHTSYLDAGLFTEIVATDLARTVRDRPNVLHDADVGAWVKHWLHCSGHGMSVSHCISPETNFPFVCCYEEVEYENELWTLLRQFDG